jgi:radical SAM protein with 4Fe4S-binding SPASM domain
MMGARKVALSGGEPLVYPELYEIVRTAASLALATTLYTTGIKNNNLDPIDESDVSRLISAGLDRIIFSIYATEPQIHNSITGFPSFEPTLVAVKNCVHGGLPGEFHFVPLRRNYHQFGEVVRLAEGLGVPRVSVLRFVPQGRGAMIREKEELPAEYYRQLGKTVEELRRRGSVQVRLGAPMNMLGLGHSCCDAAQDIVVVGHSGRVFPCDGFKGTDYPDPEYGSILLNSLPSVWERSSYLNAARHLYAEGRNGCGSCPTGCMAQQAVRKGGLLHLIQLSGAQAGSDAPEVAGDLVELKTGLAS